MYWMTILSTIHLFRIVIWQIFVKKKPFWGKATFTEEESSLKVISLAVSVDRNQSKFQNTCCLLIGRHSNLVWFLRIGTAKKMTFFKLALLYRRTCEIIGKFCENAGLLKFRRLLQNLFEPKYCGKYTILAFSWHESRHSDQVG